MRAAKNNVKRSPFFRFALAASQALRPGSLKMAAGSVLDYPAQSKEKHVQFLSPVPSIPHHRLVETIWDWEAAFQPHRLGRMPPRAHAGLQQAQETVL
jgi:hypothetical protein